MPNPVPLATKEEEERRAWVTSHHEVVRLIKDCFGDRFSNNEIFDRLKISRRTGYRALGNDERIGKAPGRKPKISEDTLREIIIYMEEGGCNDVGNVWKHLASKFAPDCNPKTVQDAIKKLGFHNHHSTVKVEPLTNPDGPEDPDSADDEPSLAPGTDVRQPPHHIQPNQHALQPQPPPRDLHQDPMPQPPTQHDVIDPAFHQQNTHQILQQAIEGSPDAHIRYVLWDLCAKMPDVQRYTAQLLLPYIAPAGPAGMGGLTGPHLPRLHPSLPSHPLPGSAEHMASKKSRVAVCRRCGQSFNRVENTMGNRQCVYHIGAISKTVDDENGNIEESPEIYMWSCCGGNGLVRGCKLAMHTTKRKRKYGKKRSATDAGIDKNDEETGDAEDEDEDEEASTLLSPRPPPTLPSNDTQSQTQAPIDTSLQDLQTHGLPSHIGILPYTGELTSPFLQHSSPSSSIHVTQLPTVQSNGHDSLPPDVRAQLHMPQGTTHQQI